MKHRLITSACLALLILACAGSRPADPISLVRRIPQGIETQRDSLWFFETASILRVIDSAYAMYVENVEKKSFTDRVSKHQNKNLEQWLRAFRGLSYARDTAKCHGQPWLPDGEIRWSHFLNFGPPTSWWEAPYETANGRDTVPTFFYWWDDIDSGLACQAESTLTYPTRVLEPLRAKMGFGKAIFPEVEVVSFPNLDNTISVLVTAVIKGDQVTEETVMGGRGKLNTNFEVRDSKRNIIAQESFSLKFGLTGLVLGVTVNKEALPISSSFSYDSLQGGDFTANVDMRGYRTNAGNGKSKFHTPSLLASQGISDILLRGNKGMVGPDLTPGIWRFGRELRSRGSHDFKIGDTISPYSEIEIPKGEGWAYSVSVFLKPKTSGKPSIPDVELFPIADSLGESLLTWAGIDIRQKLKEIKENPVYNYSRLQMLFGKAYQPEGSKGFILFDSEFQIQSMTRPDEYWLIIYVAGRDMNGQKFERSTQTEIKIKSGTFTLSKF